jgi:hypothetical protein
VTHVRCELSLSAHGQKKAARAHVFTMPRLQSAASQWRRDARTRGGTDRIRLYYSPGLHRSRASSTHLVSIAEKIIVQTLHPTHSTVVAAGEPERTHGPRLNTTSRRSLDTQAIHSIVRTGCGKCRWKRVSLLLCEVISAEEDGTMSVSMTHTVA